MRRILMLALCVVMVGALPLAADEVGDKSTSGEAGDPHRELREAVARIRAQYAPGHRPVVDYLSAGSGRPMRLGMIVGGAWLPEERTEAGAVIMAVTPGSPAAEAGLKAGDVITSFNGQSLVDDSEPDVIASLQAARTLAELSRDLENGDTVTLEYTRNGASHRVELVAREISLDPAIIGRLDRYDLADVTDFNFQRAFPNAAIWHLPKGWLDMELVALNPELGEYFGAERGVLVVRAPKEDDTLGLRSGDVILSIGDREVKSPEHAMRILRSYEPEEELLLHVIRRGRTETLAAAVPDSPLSFDDSWNFHKDWEPEDE